MSETQERLFLCALMREESIMQACAVAEVTLEQSYIHRRSSKDFRRKWGWVFAVTADRIFWRWERSGL